MNTLAPNEFHIDCDEEFEFFVESKAYDDAPMYILPLNIYTKHTRYALLQRINVHGGYGHFHTYISVTDTKIKKYICVKVLDETSLRECRDDDGVEDLSANSALGEIESYKWLLDVDPNNQMFANRFKPYRESIIGAADVLPASRKLLYSLSDMITACGDKRYERVVHYTVMELYEGNLLQLLSGLSKTRREKGASLELEESLFYKVSKLVKTTSTTLKRNGLFYKDLHLQQFLFKTNDNDVILRLTDFANVCQRNEKNRCDNYGTVVPPRYKKKTRKRKYSTEHNDWFKVFIDDDGMRYQVAFLFSEIIAFIYDFHREFFSFSRNKEMFYDGPFDKSIEKLKHLVQKLSSVRTENKITETLIIWCVRVFQKELGFAEEVKNTDLKKPQI
jgi:hypothetical protein